MTLFLLALGAALRLWQFLGRASFRESELAVVQNLTDRSPASLLTEPLAGNQVAPKGFLLLEKLMVGLFDAEELPLRLVPFLAGLVSLPLFAALGRRIGLVGGSVALALFALGVPFVSYSALVKPYALDTLATVGLLLLAFRWREHRGRTEAWLLAAGGFVAVWFSFASVLVMAGLGTAFAVSALLERDRRNVGLAIVAVTWLVGVAAAGTVIARASETSGTHDYLRTFWAPGFIPPLDQGLEVLRWLKRSFLDLVGRFLGYPWSAAYLALTAAGVGLLWHRRRDAAALLLAPVAAALVAAAAGVYPFQDRLVLFVIPPLLLLIGETAEYVWHRLGRRRRLERVAAVAPILFGPMFAVWQRPPVYRIDDMRPVLARVRVAWRPGDIAYVYHGARPVVHYYGARLGFPMTALRRGDCHRGQPRRYLEELDQLRGRARVWILLTHSHRGERNTILSYLNTIGMRRDSVGVAPRGVYEDGWASAYLYDLSDPPRLASATAATYPAVDSTVPPPTRPCY